ncbi:MAG: M23 family metallopeptidase [Acidobacteriota bacterium]|nr:M23 family metallopeptidase [Acidobacteriota bacterium]
MRRARVLVWSSLLLAAACGGSSAPARPARTTDVALAPDQTVLTAKVPRNATLSTLLHAQDLSDATVTSVIQSTRQVFDPRQLMPDHDYKIARALDGQLRDFEYQIDNDRILRVAYHPGDDEAGAYAATIVSLPKQTVEAVAAGAISSDTPSLFEAIDAAGESTGLAMELADVFGGVIDFNVDLQPGDRFKVAFAKEVRHGRVLDYGPIQAAEFDNGGRRLVAIRFTPAGGAPGYYDEDGRSLKRFFLKSPLKFEPHPRITSRFSRSRYHPILHVYRAHLGVDYHAPIGSPVVAVAGGIVLSAGWDGEGGRMVHLRHSNGYQTYYLHLSSITKGLRPGVRVTQGEVIGRSGQSGLTTGPHLDFRIRHDGRFENPVGVFRSLPPGDPISPADREAFDAVRARALSRLGEPVPAPPSTAVAAAAADNGTSGAPGPQ